MPRSGAHRATKLNWYRVRQIRAWAEREGAGLSRVEQARRLHALGYDDCTRQHIRDVLANATWVDLAYRPAEQHA